MSSKIFLNYKSHQNAVRIAVITATSSILLTLIVSAIIPKYFNLELFEHQHLITQFVTLFGFCCFYAQLIFVALYLLLVLGIWYRYKKINNILEDLFLSFEQIQIKN